MQDNVSKKGRPKGSFSFTRVRLCDLVEVMGNRVVVPVSTVWLRENNISLEGLEVAAARITPVTPAEEMPKIEFTLHE